MASANTIGTRLAAPPHNEIIDGIPEPGTNAVCNPPDPPPSPPGGHWVPLNVRDCAGVKAALSARPDYSVPIKWPAREDLLDEWDDGQRGICTYQLYGTAHTTRPDWFSLKEIVRKAKLVERFCLPGYGGEESVGRDGAWYVMIVGWKETMGGNETWVE